MKKVQRRVLFYGLIGVFLVVTPIVLVYAIGYSIDFRSQVLVPAGGIFIKTNQTGIKIFINGEEQKETSFLSSGALFNNLASGTYTVRIEKDGFRPWQKKIDVRQRIVSEYRNIFLVPNEVPLVHKKEVTRIGTFEYFPSPDGNYMGLLFNGGKIVTIESNVDHSILYRKEVPFELEKISWLDPTMAAFQASVDGREWIAVTLNDAGAAIDVKLNVEQARIGSIVSIMRDPTQSDSFFVVTTLSALYHISTGTMKIEKIIDQVIYAAILNDSFIFINDRGFLATADFTGKAVTVVGRPGFFLHGSFNAIALSDGNAIVTDGVGGVFYFDDADNKIVPIGTTTAKPSVDKKNVLGLLQNEHELSVVLLADETEAPFRKAFTTIPVIRQFPETILDTAWYGKRYILFSTEKGLYGAEFGLNENDTIIEKLADVGGFIFTDDTHVTVINDKGTYIFAIE